MRMQMRMQEETKMALIKNVNVQTPAASTQAEAQPQPHTETGFMEPETSQEAPSGAHPEVTLNTPAIVSPAPQRAARLGSVQDLAEAGFEGLEIDWTSFPTISLKTEGVFVDIEGQDYGTSFDCRIMGSKKRYVYRAVPVQDNKRDVAFSYDKETTHNGKAVAEVMAEWKALGKHIEEKEYLEVMLEMVAPGESYDGEYRLVSISPTSKGRFSKHAMVAHARGNGDPSAVVTRISVGPKVTKVQNPFYPFHFEIAA